MAMKKQNGERLYYQIMLLKQLDLFGKVYERDSLTCSHNTVIIRYLTNVLIINYPDPELMYPIQSSSMP